MDPAKRDTSVLTFGEFELDFQRLELRRNGERVDIKPTPLRVLLYLAERRDRTVMKRELLDTQWPDAIVTDTSLANALSQARRAVGDDGTAQAVIRTQKGHGYRFVAAILEPPEPAVEPEAAVDEPAAPSCPRCGAELPTSARFCLRCGEPMGDAAAPERAPRTYTPEHLADRILESKSALEGERKQVTVLFARVKNAIELADRCPPEEWQRILDRFFQILSESVHRFEGIVHPHTGDGIMALFGAPIAHEDHAPRACYAALRIRDELRRLGDELRSQRGIDFQTSIGLNSGDMIVWKIGEDLRMEYTAQGQTVDLASRMEQLGSSGEVRLTEHTGRLVKGFFDLNDLGPTRFEGSGESVRVHALARASHIRTRLELAQSRGLSAFVGRDRELGVLEAALQQAMAGRGQIAGVVGQAGVGKSRLCREFVLSCRERGLRVDEAHCPPHGRTEPYGAIVQLLRSMLGLTPAERDDAARSHVAARLRELDPDLEDSLPLAFDLLGMSDAEEPLLQMDPRARERSLLRLVAQVVRLQSQVEPIVLFLDDTHWIDDASDVFLSRIAQAVTGAHTLLLVNFRPEYQAEWMKGPDYQQLPLHPLAPEDADALLIELLGEAPEHRALRRRISEHTGGVPFFIEEVVQSLSESGRLTGVRGAYELAAPLGELAIPATVQDVLFARIDRLAERAKRVLQTAAVIGRDVPETLLARVAELPRAELDAALEQLRRAEFLYETPQIRDTVHAFKHPFTRDAAYDSQLHDQRARTHAAVAAALVKTHGSQAPEHGMLIGHHLAAAGERLEAASWYSRASVALRSKNYREAYGCCLAGLEALGDVEQLAPAEIERGAELGMECSRQALYYGGFLDISQGEAIALLEPALDMAGHLSNAVQRYLQLMGLHVMYSDVALGWDEDESMRHVDHVRDFAARSGDPGARIQAAIGLSARLYQSERYDDAWEAARVEIENPPSNPLVAVDLSFWSIPFPRLLSVGAAALAYCGRPRDAMELLGNAIELIRKDRRPLLPKHLTLHHAQASYHVTGEEVRWCILWGVPCCYFLGDLEGISNLARELLERAQRLDAARLDSTAAWAMSFALHLERNWHELVDVIDRAVVLSGGFMARVLREGSFPAWRAEARAHLGGREAAIEQVETLLSEKDLERDPGALASCAHTLIYCEGAQRVEQIALVFGRLECAIERTGARAYVPFLHALRAQLARACGDEGTCERERAAAEHLWTDTGAHGHIERFRAELEELTAQP